MPLFGSKTPNARDVASRALIHKSQIVKTASTPPPEMYPQMVSAWSAEDRQKFDAECRENNSKLEHSLRDAKLWSKMSDGEKRITLAIPGEFTGQDMVNASWLTESLGCLLWSLGILDETPAYDTQFEMKILKFVPEPSDARNFIKRAKLRPLEEIERAQSIAELWHWRSRTRWLQENQPDTKGPNEMSLDEIVRVTSKFGREDGLFANSIDEDFPAFGKAYRDLSDEEWSQCTSIAMERHKAFNWLCGSAPGHRWEETPTDT